MTDRSEPNWGSQALIAIAGGALFAIVILLHHKNTILKSQLRDFRECELRVEKVTRENARLMQALSPR